MPNKGIFYGQLAGVQVIVHQYLFVGTTNRSLFDGVELCRHCPGVVDQALVHGMNHKEKASTQANLEQK